MANKTNNYKLPKPEADDFYDISEYNKTMDILDDSLTEMEQKKLDKNGDASEAITEFDQEILRENIESGESLSTTFGKVKKWFSEMKDVAFSGLAKDVATDAGHRFVSDTEKSSWNGKVEAVGGDISENIINFLESTTTDFPIPEQGETSKVFFGKVKKFIQDFNNFKSGIITVGRLVNSGNITSEGYALDARYGKTLFDLYTKLNSDLAKVWINVDVSIFENPIVMQKQASIKTMKISTYLKDKVKGITGNNIYTLCTLPEAYRPATTVIINLPCGRYAGDTTSIPDYAYVRINTDGTVVLSPFDNITNHAINMQIAYF